jgi:Zn-dependent protease
MNLQTALIFVPVIIISIVFHEFAHGWAALKFGDDTAKRMGRLTLNPIPHIDLFGSIILPGLLMLMGAPVLAWAKPVPVNFYNLYPNRLGTICVTLAGITVNLFIVIVAGLALRLMPSSANSIGILSLITLILFYTTFINLLLAVFNLLPIPPLDGWRLWGIWLPEDIRMKIEMNAMWLILLLIFIIQFLPILPIMKFLFTLITGMSF